MGLLSFLGGIHPPHEKSRTEKLPIEEFPAPELVKIPLRQHIGAPCNLTAKKGDVVFVGTLLAAAEGFVSTNIHSSVSGVVKEIKKEETAYGMDTVVYIENDGEYRIDPSISPYPDYRTLTKEEIVKGVEKAGIVGMGGAGFPTHVKIGIPPNKKADTVILNGAECEPYLTCDHRMMLEEPHRILRGLLIAQKAIGAEYALIGVEDNKKDAIASLKAAAEAGKEEFSHVEILPLATKYPQGAEKQLIYATTGREIPSGGLPVDAGVVVLNVSTAAQIAKTWETGLPLIDRVCTVTGGAIENPKNLRFRIGTPLHLMIEHCGLKEEPAKVILGGPMMGVSQYNDRIPAMKNTSGVLCLTKGEAAVPKSTLCIKCGKCLTVCPIRLQPIEISTYSLIHNYERCRELHVMDCIECGSCSYICPAKRPLLQSIRVAKKEVLSMRRRNG